MWIGDRNILCVDWDERWLRALDGQFRRGSLKIRKVVLAALPAGVNSRDPAEMGAFLRRTLGEHRIRTRRAVVDVPRQDAVFALMPLPLGTVEETAAMVQVQAAKELPFARDQAVVDFAITDQVRGGMRDIWMAAVRTAVVDRYRQTIVEAGLKVDRIGLRPYANVAALRAMGLADGRTLLVDIGPSMTEIDVVADGLLVYSRAASVSLSPEGGGSERSTVPAEAVEGEDTIPLVDEGGVLPTATEALLIEVGRTVEAYRATAPGTSIGQVVLAGTLPLDEGVVARFEERFGAPVRVYVLSGAMGWPQGRGAPGAAAFSAVIGQAMSGLAGAEVCFDFLHPKEPEAVGRVRKRQRPVLAATIALFVVAAGVAATQPVRSRRAQVEALKLKVRFANSDEKARKELLAQLSDAQAWQASSVIWIDELRKLSDVFPSNREGYITKLECTEKRTINVDMVTKDPMVATAIVDKTAAITDGKGKPLYRAKPGKMEESGLTDYGVKDRVIIEMERAAEGS